VNVRKERSGWRDEGLSQRHRTWGWDCPAVDIDWLVLEFDTGRAIAIVEYKNENAKICHASHPSYQALIDLGNRASLPVFACRYASDFSWFRPTPLNKVAHDFLPEVADMKEQEWVAFIYRLRGREMPAPLTARTGQATFRW
jgi:hypothetical protein